MRRHRLRLVLAPAAALAVALAGCGSDEPDQSGSPGAGETTSADPGTDTGSPGDMAAATQLMVAETDLGPVLVDGEGMTLYLFTQDSPGSSVCEGECLAAWPPLEGEPQAGDGVDEELLGSIERGDGTVQATYNDWPLYYFAQDAAPGDVNGQGINEVWWVVSPEGEAVTGTGTQSEDEDRPGYGGYGG
jgi:predicted lipoprotein with Yx(FWY)xxD motif